MGSNFFKSKGPAIHASGGNFTARAIGATAYGGRAAGGKAGKDLGAAAGLAHAGGLKPGVKTAATAAPGPKKV